MKVCIAAKLALVGPPITTRAKFRR